MLFRLHAPLLGLCGYFTGRKHFIVVSALFLHLKRDINESLSIPPHNAEVVNCSEIPLQKARQQGFTLIELSIVLVIIGLIVGGVLVGQTLIRQANLQSVMTDITKIKTAINAYRGKYDALPGDDSQAQRWFGATACPDYNPPISTCNGNNNGTIESIGNWNETYMAPMHLSLAGLIPGSYTGKYGDTSTNLWPPSKLSQGVYRIGNDPTVYGRTGHYIQLGTPAAFFTAGSVLNVPDAYFIDLKMDDGQADGGNVMAYPGQDVASGTCTTTNYNQPQGSYVMSNTNLVCIMVFWLN
jgi:prepilin-type N-terminal cleavage/methylation domain-containing protein